MEFGQTPWLRFDDHPASPGPGVVRARLLAARGYGASEEAILAAHARLEAGMRGGAPGAVAASGPMTSSAIPPARCAATAVPADLES